MKRNNKALYEQIMRNVSKNVKQTLNESIDDNTPLDVKALDSLKTMLLRFMKSYDVDYKELNLYIKAALKDAKKQLSVYKKAATLKPQELADWLQSYVTDVIQNAVDDSSEWGTHWYYDDFIMDNQGYCDFITDTLNDNWGDVAESLDPRELYDNFEDYFDHQTPNKQKQIASFVNNIAFNYFKGNTDANWKDYADD